MLAKVSPSEGLPYWLLPIPLAIIGMALYVLWDWRRHRKPLLDENPNIKYTIWHHIQVVTIPLCKYRISFVVSHPTHTQVEDADKHQSTPKRPSQSA